MCVVIDPQRVKRNLHIVLCMSPIGDAFRDRIRKFPALVNCCTIDWFSAWPADALVAVAKKTLSKMQLTPGESGSSGTCYCRCRYCRYCRYCHRIGGV